MAFNNICNNPEQRSTITYAWKVWSGLFSVEELNTLNDYLNTLDLDRATTQTDIFWGKIPLYKINKALISVFHPLNF